MSNKKLVRTITSYATYRYEVWVEYMMGDGDEYRTEKSGNLSGEN